MSCEENVLVVIQVKVRYQEMICVRDIFEVYNIPRFVTPIKRLMTRKMWYYWYS